MKRSASLVRALPAVTLLLYLVLSEPLSVLLLFFGALAMHEWGHLCAFRLVKAGIPSCRFDGVGARLYATLPLLPGEEAIVALAGPLFNLVFALFSLRFGRGGFFLLSAVVHLLFALGNLLPFGSCDGERLLRLLFDRLCPRYTAGLLAFLGTTCLALFFYFSLFTYYLTGNGLCGIFFALFFLFRDETPCFSANDFFAKNGVFFFFARCA